MHHPGTDARAPLISCLLIIFHQVLPTAFAACRDEDAEVAGVWREVGCWGAKIITTWCMLCLCLGFYYIQSSMRTCASGLGDWTMLPRALWALQAWAVGILDGQGNHSNAIGHSHAPLPCLQVWEEGCASEAGAVRLYAQVGAQGMQLPCCSLPVIQTGCCVPSVKPPPMFT